MTEIFTIGHSNHDLFVFLDMLKKHSIDVLVDVRSDPYSRFAPQFNKSDFQRHVEVECIEYKYSGASIGGKPKDPSLLTPLGAPDYDKLASTESFQRELREVVELAKQQRVVLMCSEADAQSCHRERIIAQVLRSWGVKVTHILPDGCKEKVAQPGLF